MRATGLDALHVGEIGLAQASDAEILDRGRDEIRVIVTLDADFHRLMALSGATRPSVIRIRVEGLRATPRVDLLLRVIHDCAQDLLDGALVSVLPDSVRIRKLPIP